MAFSLLKKLFLEISLSFPWKFWVCRHMNVGVRPPAHPTSIVERNQPTRPHTSQGPLPSIYTPALETQLSLPISGCSGPSKQVCINVIDNQDFLKLSVSRQKLERLGQGRQGVYCPSFFPRTGLPSAWRLKIIYILGLQCGLS